MEKLTLRTPPRRTLLVQSLLEHLHSAPARQVSGRLVERLLEIREASCGHCSGLFESATRYSMAMLSEQRHIVWHKGRSQSCRRSGTAAKKVVNTTSSTLLIRLSSHFRLVLWVARNITHLLWTVSIEALAAKGVTLDQLDENRPSGARTHWP